MDQGDHEEEAGSRFHDELGAQQERCGEGGSGEHEAAQTIDGETPEQSSPRRLRQSQQRIPRPHSIGFTATISSRSMSVSVGKASVRGIQTYSLLASA